MQTLLPQQNIFDCGTVDTPPDLLERRTMLFCARILLAATIIVGASACMATGSPLLFTLGLLVQGAMYVHLIELQHSVLHGHVFVSNKISRTVGFFLGLPMLISYSDFQYRHLRHHKFLGTEFNTETFSYQYDNINSLFGFFKAALDYSRALTFCERVFLATIGETVSDGQNAVMEERISQEYRLFGTILLCTVIYSVLTVNFWPLLIWLAPLLVAEPIHFLLELPEHFGLPARSNTNVFENTRIWGGSSFARWYTHNTNLHLVHHFNQNVPMDNLDELEQIIAQHIPEASRSESYPGFYRQVISGELRAYRNERE